MSTRDSRPHLPVKTGSRTEFGVLAGVIVRLIVGRDQVYYETFPKLRKILKFLERKFYRVDWLRPKGVAPGPKFKNEMIVLIEIAYLPTRGRTVLSNARYE